MSMTMQMRARARLLHEAFGADEFTVVDIREAGLSIPPAQLTGLRSRGIVNDRAQDLPAGATRRPVRRRGDLRLWRLTPDAIKTLAAKTDDERVVIDDDHPLRSKAWLEDHYTTRGLTIAAIARLLQVSDRTVSVYLEQHGIARRRPGRAAKVWAVTA